MPFASLGLSPALALALSDEGHTEPTEIQQAAIPVILQGCDLWACAPTGSGKTAAFLLPLLELLSQTESHLPHPTRVLVVVPTRELAQQIGQVAKTLSRHLSVPLKIRVAVGGLSINPQMMALRGGADLLIATPGRLLDLLAHRALRLSGLDCLVLDEADRLLSLGFEEQLSEVLELLPSSTQILLFSATFPPSVQKLAEQRLKSPCSIQVKSPPLGIVNSIEQRAIEVDPGRRTALLYHLLQSEGFEQVLVFAESRHGVEHLAQKLRRRGVQVTALHGDLSQGARTSALEDFKTNHCQVLVATDVAARGLDIRGLPVVINYDLPRSPTDYLHRIGRTGRAGEKGVAITFVTAGTAAHFRLIEKRHKFALVREQIPEFLPENVSEAPSTGGGGIKGRRKSKKDKLREQLCQEPPLRTPVR